MQPPFVCFQKVLQRVIVLHKPAAQEALRVRTGYPDETA